jgi:hypothetical protein
MFKKAQGMMMGGPRKPISLLLGLAFIILGGLPLLNKFGVLSFEIPPVTGVILWVLAIVGGVILMWDAISEGIMAMGITQQIRMASIIGGLVLLAVGIIPMLHSFGMIGFDIPVFAAVVQHVLFVVFGVLLIYGGTQGF